MDVVIPDCLFLKNFLRDESLRLGRDTEFLSLGQFPVLQGIVLHQTFRGHPVFLSNVVNVLVPFDNVDEIVCALSFLLLPL